MEEIISSLILKIKINEKIQYIFFPWPVESFLSIYFLVRVLEISTIKMSVMDVMGLYVKVPKINSAVSFQK